MPSPTHSFAAFLVTFTPLRPRLLLCLQAASLFPSLVLTCLCQLSDITVIGKSCPTLCSLTHLQPERQTDQQTP